jgi:hypothetical protein
MVPSGREDFIAFDDPLGTRRPVTGDTTPAAEDGSVLPVPEVAWTPTFSPEIHPETWVAFARLSQGVEMLSSEPLDPDDRRWLATWLSHHELRDPDGTASYVYLGLGAGWREQPPGGSRTPRGGTGVGSGIGFAEPPGAEPAHIAEIVRLACELLGDPGRDGEQDG